MNLRYVRNIRKERAAFAQASARLNLDEDLAPEDLLSLYVSERVTPTHRSGRPVDPDLVIVRVTSAREWRLSSDAGRTIEPPEIPAPQVSSIIDPQEQMLDVRNTERVV